MLHARRLIAEWEPQQAVLLVWPDEHTDWKPWLSDVQNSYEALIQQIRVTTPVWLLVRSEAVSGELEERFAHGEDGLAELRFQVVDYSDTWVRDFGPISVERSAQDGIREVLGLDFNFNGWGGKYEVSADNAVNQQLKDQWPPAYRYESCDFTLEGGAIETNGRGLLLATPSTIVDDARDNRLAVGDVEALFKQTLGIEQVDWLPPIRLAGDDTDGHVDTLVRFVDENTVVCVVGDREAGANAEAYTQLAGWAEQWAAQSPERKAVFLPVPSPRLNEAGELLPATYANFLMTNGQIIVPTYRDDNDQHAIECLKKLCPKWSVVGVDASVLIEQFGSIHCSSMPLFE